MKKYEVSKKKIILKAVLIVLVCAVIILLLTPKIKRSVHDRNLKTIEVNGVQYRQKPKIESYVLMGIDHMEDGDKIYGSPLGDNDLNLVMVIDHKNHTWQLLLLNRDSMMNVETLDVFGKKTGTIFEQLTLAHSYGDGGKQSCQNVVNTISNLLWNQDINGYISMDMQAVNVLTDAVGGVKVHVDDDFTTIDPTLKKGQDVVLNSQNALNYVRGREQVGDQTNESRQKRQQQFMKAFMEKINTLNAFQIAGLYEKAKDYIAMDISPLTLFDIAYCYKTYQRKPMVTVEGTSRVSKITTWNEYHLKQSSLQKTILSLFYEKQS